MIKQRDQQTQKAINSVALIMIFLATALLLASNKFPFKEIIGLIPGRTDGSVTKKTNFSFEDLVKIQKIYNNVLGKMTGLEADVQKLGNKGLIAIAIILLFATKSFFSVVPISATCILSGVIFHDHPIIAFAINLIGITSIMTIKYYWGMKIGEGNMAKVLKHYPTTRKLLEIDNAGNPWMLFVFRLVPSFPINPISQLYGHMQFGYKKYILLSLAGFSIKLISYTLIGAKVYNPFSAAFIVPIIVILYVSGFSMLIVNGIIFYNDKKKKNRVKLKEEND